MSISPFGVILTPVSVMSPVSVTMTFPVFACPHEKVSFERTSIVPPLHSGNVAVSGFAVISGRRGSVRVTVIGAELQLVGLRISQIWYVRMKVPV